MLRQWVLRKSFKLFKKFRTLGYPKPKKIGISQDHSIMGYPKTGELGYPNFGIRGTIGRGGTFLKHGFPLRD